MATYKLSINNQNFSIEADADMPLLWVLRDLLDLKGTKFGCGIAQCGACTVHVNNNAVRSCALPVSAVKGNITTIEGLSSDGSHVLQKAWIDSDVPQCGYCQTGQIMSAAALLSKKANPSDDDINAALSGHICRCGTYTRIRKAIHMAAQNGTRK
jgi:isoquinoline 1-oxidoreductase alpha subunit